MFAHCFNSTLKLFLNCTPSTEKWNLSHIQSYQNLLNYNLLWLSPGSSLFFALNRIRAVWNSTRSANFSVIVRLYAPYNLHCRWRELLFFSKWENSLSPVCVALLVSLPLVWNKSMPTGDYSNLLVTKPITHPLCYWFHLAPAHYLHNHCQPRIHISNWSPGPCDWGLTWQLYRDMRKKTVAPKAGRIPRKMNANKDAVLIWVNVFWFSWTSSFFKNAWTSIHPFSSTYLFHSRCSLFFLS